MKCRQCKHDEMSHQFRHTQGTFRCFDCSDWCDLDTSAQSISDFFNEVIHTAHKDVPSIAAMTAGEFLIKMASLREHVAFSFDGDLFVTADTTEGTYRFAIDSEHNTLIVDQIL